MRKSSLGNTDNSPGEGERRKVYMNQMRKKTTRRPRAETWRRRTLSWGEEGESAKRLIQSDKSKKFYRREAWEIGGSVRKGGWFSHWGHEFKIKTLDGSRNHSGCKIWTGGEDVEAMVKQKYHAVTLPSKSGPSCRHQRTGFLILGRACCHQAEGPFYIWGL